MIKRPLAFIACLFLISALMLMKLHPVRGCLPDISEGETVTVKGRLKEKQRKNDSYILVLSDAAPENGEGHKNKILVYLNNEYSSYEDLPPLGAKVVVSGTYSLFDRATNPGQFDMREHYHIRGIEYRLFKAGICSCSKNHDRLTEGLFRIRIRAADIFDRLLTKKDSGILKAMILGDRTGIDPEIRSLYQENGIAHALSISGLHISILGYGLYRLLKRTGLNIPVSALICGITITLYALMVSGGTSTVRAVIMFGTCLLSDITGRSYDLLSALSLSLMMILFTDPLYIYDAGFMLSFGSVLGIALVCPAIKESSAILSSKVCSGLTASLSVSLFTLPITLYFFFEFPVYSLLLNLAVIPLMGLLVVSSLLMWFFGLWVLYAAVPFGFFCHLILKLYEKGCLFCQDLPNAAFTAGRPEQWKIWSYYIFLLLILYLIKKTGKHKGKGRRRKRRLLLFMMLLLPGIFLFRPCKDVSYTMLDIGQGDCNVIMDKNKKTVMIDCGSSSVKEIGRYRVIPFLKYSGTKVVDVMVVTHPDSDHISGLTEILDMERMGGIKIKSLIMPGIKNKDEEYLELIRKAEKAGIEVTYFNEGSAFDTGNVSFHCLWPEKGFEASDRNEYSTVLYMEARELTALFTGDIQGEGEKRLIKHMGKNVRPCILKTAHHGSRNSTPEEFLERTEPHLALISAGKNNRYGHPHRELIKRLQDFGCRILTTAEDGAITVTKDGKRIIVSAFSGHKALSQ